VRMDHHLLILGIITAGFLARAVWAVFDYRRYKRRRKDVTRIEGYLPTRSVDSLNWPALPSPSRPTK
jgi:hypothetical protein